MRKLILTVAAVGAALVAASPAAAQYYPAPQPYGYNGYGFQNNWGQVRALQARIDNVERRINWLDRRDRIGDGRADRLREEADRIEHRLHERARGGLNPYEMRDIEVRIARLEQRVQYSVANGYGRYGYRDRDDRWDRDGDRRWDRDDD
jgi:hypothetical protein